MKKEHKQMKKEELARTNEVLAVMVAKLARDGLADNRIAFFVREGMLTGNTAAEAYILSGVGKVPMFEIMEHLIKSDANFVLEEDDATPAPDPAPDLANMTPIQKMVIARTRKTETEK